MLLSITEDLGGIDDSGMQRQARSTTTYLGSTVRTTTQRTGNDGTLETLTRDERRNAVGKVVATTDPDGTVLEYTYDADGNLTDTLNSTNPTIPHIHVDYEKKRGFKQSVDDPDVGHWEYTYNSFGELFVRSTRRTSRSRCRMTASVG